MKTAFACIILVVLAACADRSIAPVIPAAAKSADVVSVLVATNRARDSLGYFGDDRAESTAYLTSNVSMPVDRKPGDAPIYNKKPNPKKHFVLTEQSQFASDQAFINHMRKKMAALPPQNREITLYVHGFYNGYADTVFRVAQMKSDFGMPGEAMVFSWPSAGHPAAYTYDRESVLFARDSLEKTLYLLSQTGAKNLLIVGHSMGALLVMETLRQIEISRPGWSSSNVASVALISPDIAVDVFHEQASRIKKLPDPFVVVTSEYDRALKLSTRLNKMERLGLGTSDAELSEFPITFIDVSDFSKDSANSHFVVLESPALIAMLEGASAHTAFTQSRARSFLDTLSDGGLPMNKAVEYELSPDDGLTDTRQ